MDFSLTTLYVLQNGDLAPANFKRENLAPRQFGIFNSRYKAVVDAAGAEASPYIQFGQGRVEQVPGLTGKYSDKISQKSIIEWYKATASATSKNQITYLGWDGVSDCKSLTGDCDSEYSVTIRAFSKYINTAYSGNGLTRSVTIKTPCCADCADNCTTIDPKWLSDAIANAINAEPLLSRYVVASSVTSCDPEITADKVQYETLTLTNTDAGTAEELADIQATITTGTVSILSTNGVDSTTYTFTQLASEATPVGWAIASTSFRYAKTVCLTINNDLATAEEVEDFYPDYVVTAEEEGDCTTKYSITLESDQYYDNAEVCETFIASTFPDLQDFKGLAWADCPCPTANESTCLAGVKIEGKALDTYGNPCDPIAFPFEYDKLRFDVFASKAPATSQDFDTWDRCENWAVTKVQNATYPTGSGKEIKVLELRYHSYQTTFKHIYHSPLYNGAFTQYTDESIYYDTFYIKFKSPDLNTWYDVSRQDEMVIIAVPTGEGDDIEDFLTDFFGEPSFNAGVL